MGTARGTYATEYSPKIFTEVFAVGYYNRRFDWENYSVDGYPPRGDACQVAGGLCKTIVAEIFEIKLFDKSLHFSDRHHIFFLLKYNVLFKCIRHAWHIAGPLKKRIL